ncbi:mitochondrial adenyl nucleotide antiporter SLC25A24-B [Patella vulgata]|uniref:mitochondrial adenyl nucleotide antiporter SLC25A24-B n=1 Tax=Patella vulgata TaxID=6465 RepID=UPI00217FEE58|nr:mitochondrial adenyl nucleotide antiporter SLC25A24-B [Patella vulgata]
MPELVKPSRPDTIRTITEDKKLEELFKKIDINKDGRIDIEDLSKALKAMDVPTSPGHAQKIFDKYDEDNDGQIDFGEFVKYVTEHEQTLKLFFKKIDTNEDGIIDANEIRESFLKLGVKIEIKEAEDLLKRMDKDGTLKIDWNEWRDYLLLTSSQNIHDILHYWRHSSIIDIGENGMVPDDFTEKELKSGLWWRQLVAGGAAGAVSRTFTAPLDRLKVMLQVHGSTKNISIVSGFKHMLDEGGVRSLWRGNFMNVIKIAPESAIKFMAYEQIKTLIKGDSKHEIGVLERLLSGSAAGAISQTVIYPMELLKTRLALRKTGQYNGIFDCAKKILKAEGFASFYRGYIPNLIGIIPYAGIDLAIYETLKKFYMSKHKGQDPGVFVLLGCGTASSTCGQLASYPLALIRTRLQAQSSTQKDSMGSMFTKILKNDGPLGFYRGIAPNFLKVAPAVSISYVVYEQVRKYLGMK